MRSPDLIEPVIGFRTWWLQPGQRRLTSMLFTECLWPERAEAAACPFEDQHPGRQPAVAGCSCGWYAAHRIEDALSYACSLLANGEWAVLGAVKAWGCLQSSGRCFRAEYAAPLALCDPSWMRLYDRSWLDAVSEDWSTEAGFFQAHGFKQLCFPREAPERWASDAQLAALRALPDHSRLRRRVIGEIAAHYGVPVIRAKRIETAVADLGTRLSTGQAHADELTERGIQARAEYAGIAGKRARRLSL
jgi:hypothetical protein